MVFKCDELGLPIRLVTFYVPGEDSLEDRYNSFYDSLLREIKKRLYSAMRDDPDIRIEMPIDQLRCFQQWFGVCPKVINGTE